MCVARRSISIARRTHLSDASRAKDLVLSYASRFDSRVLTGEFCSRSHFDGKFRFGEKGNARVHDLVHDLRRVLCGASLT